MVCKRHYAQLLDALRELAQYVGVELWHQYLPITVRDFG